MYIYESHMGGLFVSSYILDYEQTCCEICGDSDLLIGYSETREEAWNLLKGYTNINGSGGYDYGYVQEFLKNREENDAKMITSGYCIIIRDFTAYTVPFKTINVEYAVNTIPWYKIELPNGEIEGFNETDLIHSKEECEKMCKKLNKEMEKDREFWFSEGLHALRRLNWEE